MRAKSGNDSVTVVVFQFQFFKYGQIGSKHPHRVKDIYGD